MGRLEEPTYFSVLNNCMKTCLLPKMSIFNLRGRGYRKHKMVSGGEVGRAIIRGNTEYITNTL